MTTDITSTAAAGSTLPRRRPWRHPVVLLAAAVVGVAGVAGVGALTMDDAPSGVVPAGQAATAERLIVPEEQAFIDAIHGRVPVAHVATDPWCATHRPC